MGFIDAARVLFLGISNAVKARELTWILELDDHISRRDQLHATINSLPDPNYATLRALTLVRNIIILQLQWKLIS